VQHGKHDIQADAGHFGRGIDVGAHAALDGQHGVFAGVRDQMRFTARTYRSCRLRDGACSMTSAAEIDVGALVCERPAAVFFNTYRNRLVPTSIQVLS
jgi:hypothetical protein